MDDANLSRHGDPMRHTLVFLALLIVWTGLAGVEPLQSAQVVLGRVLSIDRERAEVVVVPVGGETQGEGMADVLMVTYPPDGVPPRLKAGDVVRIWGDYSTADRTRFDATHVGYGHGHMDPTGVRSRIGRSRGMGRGGGRGGHR